MFTKYTQYAMAFQRESELLQGTFEVFLRILKGEFCPYVCVRANIGKIYMSFLRLILRLIPHPTTSAWHGRAMVKHLATATGTNIHRGSDSYGHGEASIPGT